MITDWEFSVWFDGFDWNARGQCAGWTVLGHGSTPVTAMMNAEAKARVKERDARAGVAK